MQKQLITTMSTSLRATVAHHHANDNNSPPVVPAVNTVYPDHHLSLAFLYEVGPMLPDALDIVLVTFWGNKKNLDATIAGVSKARNRRFWEVRLAKSQAFSVICDEDEERTAAGLYSLLRRHPDLSTLFVRKWDALVVLSEALRISPTNANICGAFITTLDMRNLNWETVTSWSLVAGGLLDGQSPAIPPSPENWRRNVPPLLFPCPCPVNSICVEAPGRVERSVRVAFYF